MTAEILRELELLRAALVRFVAILERENWEFMRAWQGYVARIDDVLNGDTSREQILDTVRTIGSAFGVGMGSMTDITLGVDYDQTMDEILNRAGRISHLTRAPKGYVPRIRRHLTALEDALLDAGRTNDAMRLRVLLREEHLDLDAARAIMNDLEADTSLSASAHDAIGGLRAELD